MQLSLDLPRPPGMTAEPRSFEDEAAEDNYHALLSELRASAASEALIDEVHEIRTDSAKKEAFAEAVWEGMATKYEMAKLHFAVDVLLQGSMGSLGVLARGVGAARGGTVTLYHGTTRSTAWNIMRGGFKTGLGDAVFFAEEASVAERFGRQAMFRRGASSGSLLILRVPESMMGSFARAPIGSYAAARGGAEHGFELILFREGLPAFNAAIKDGTIFMDMVRIP
jgi:hypothetical protein